MTSLEVTNSKACFPLKSVHLSIYVEVELLSKLAFVTHCIVKKRKLKVLETYLLLALQHGETVR